MDTKTLIEKFYEDVQKQDGWESFFSSDLLFISNGKKIPGKANALVGISRFYGMVESFEINELLVYENKASSVVEYVVKAPNGYVFSSNVAEFFTIVDGKCKIFAIYFDSAPYSPR